MLATEIRLYNSIWKLIYFTRENYDIRKQKTLFLAIYCYILCYFGCARSLAYMNKLLMVVAAPIRK